MSVSENVFYGLTNRILSLECVCGFSLLRFHLLYFIRNEIVHSFVLYMYPDIEL